MCHRNRNRVTKALWRELEKGWAVACVSAINCHVTSHPKPSKQLTMMGICYLACETLAWTKFTA